MNSFRLMSRMLLRDWRAGELSVLALALLLATAALTSVAFLTDRVGRALTLESHQMLGGDLLLSADHPWSPAHRREAAARGLAIAESENFISMVRFGGAAQLADVKAVSGGYPLRGRLRTAAVLNGPDRERAGIPASGTGSRSKCR